MAGFPWRSLTNTTNWLLGEKIGLTSAGSLARCSAKVSSRRAERINRSRYGDALLPLTPTHTLESALPSNCTNCEVFAPGSTSPGAKVKVAAQGGNSPPLLAMAHVRLTDRAATNPDVPMLA